MTKWRTYAAAAIAGMMMAAPGAALAGTPGSPFLSTDGLGGKYIQGIHVADRANVCGVLAWYALETGSEDAAVQNADGCVLEPDAKAATGCLVTSTLPDGTTDSCVLVVTGDVTGTGVYSLGQLVNMAKGITKGFETRASQMAADLNADGNVSVSDLVAGAKLLGRETSQSVLAAPASADTGRPSVVRPPLVRPALDEQTRRMAEESCELVNVVREAAGQSPLTVNPDLTRAAMVRVQEIVASGQFAHVRPDGSKSNTVFSGPELRGENLARHSGYSDDNTVEVAVRALTDSESHRHNMCLECYTQMGAAYMKAPDGIWYTCHVFANNGEVTYIAKPAA